jgi:hypothetical protein
VEDKGWGANEGHCGKRMFLLRLTMVVASIVNGSDEATDRPGAVRKWVATEKEPGEPRWAKEPRKALMQPQVRVTVASAERKARMGAHMVVGQSVGRRWL